MAYKEPAFKPKSRLEQIIEARHGLTIQNLLYGLYVEQGLSQGQVAAALGVSTRSVLRWMADYGIPARDRRKVAA